MHACATFARRALQHARALWLARAAGFGEAIRVQQGSETLEGRFGGIDEEGALLLDQGSGAVRAIHSGDVFFTAVKPDEA